MSVRLLVVIALVSSFAPGCSCNSKTNETTPDSPSECNPACTDGLVCRYDTCVPSPTPCATNADCNGDYYCDTSAGECLPWGVGPGGASDMACKREPVPGVFFPGAQCEWFGPPAGDSFENHKNVLATPMVATFYRQTELPTPSIVFTTYNGDDGSDPACKGTDPLLHGVIRIIDGRDCKQQATLPAPTVVGSASVAIADLGGDPTPEIVAAATDGSLVAFTLRPNGWEVLWQTQSRIFDELCNWAGPSIHDLDDDGMPEVLMWGAVYDAAGNTLDETIVTAVDNVRGYIPVVADVDGDGNADLVAGTQLYTWDRPTKKWVAKQAIPSNGNGHTAVADFGTFPASGADDRGTLDGIAEIVVVHLGVAKVFNIAGRELFTASLLPLVPNETGRGGPPTIADFDGDGRVEFASAGASAYHVFDMDCIGTPNATTCASMRTDGILWVQQSQDFSSNTTGSSVFDFDGDDRAEVVYGDECFTRVYDGITGKVVYSRYRTSCTWYENPLVVDVDADYNAEIISTSNTNCNVTCPAVDPIFDGVQCLDDSDCPGATGCGREQPNDPLGRCRCQGDVDCGGDGFVCADPIAGPSAAGRVCRASYPPNAASTGIRVLADTVDRWGNTRTIWNQHAYAVTNIDERGKVPRTSQWQRNWTQPGLNNFRQNTPGEGAIPGAIPDLTVRQASVTCEAGGPVVKAEVCNRGTEPVAQGIPVAVYAVGPPQELRCQTTTTQRMFPGSCADVSCTWMGAQGSGVVAVDDRGDASGTNLECREDNNQLPIMVSCP